MTEDFISDQTPDPETPLPANTPSEPHRVPLKILVISSPKVVNSTIHTFYRLGYAEVSEWSKPQHTEEAFSRLEAIWQQRYAYLSNRHPV